MPGLDFVEAPKEFVFPSVGTSTTPRGPLRGTGTELATLTADGWTETPFPYGVGSIEVKAMAAVPDGWAFLDQRGALRHIDETGQARDMAPPWSGLVSEWDEYVLVYDEPRDALVLFNTERRTTWVFTDDAWTRLDGPRPSGDEVRLCGTPRGVYLLSGSALWLLDEDEWAPVGRAEPGWRGNLLWWSPRLGGLWVLTDDTIDIWTADGPRTALTPNLPAVRRGHYFENTWDQVVTTAYDPAADVLLWENARYKVFGEASGMRMLSLSDIEPPHADLPEPDPDLHIDDTHESDEEEDFADDDVASNGSFYMVEFSLHRAGYEHANVFLTWDLDGVRGALEDGVEDTEAFEPSALRDWRLSNMTSGETVCVWTVQAGVLAAGLDVTPYLRAHFSAGVSRTAAELRASSLTSGAEEPGEVERFSVDWEEIETRLPRLQPSLADEDAFSFSVRLVGPHPAPQIDTYLDQCLAGDDHDDEFTAFEPFWNSVA